MLELWALVKHLLLTPCVSVDTTADFSYFADTHFRASAPAHLGVTVNKPNRRQFTFAVAASLGLAACAGDPAPTGSGSGQATGGADGASAVVVDTSFDLKTIDPARQFEPTGGIVDKALYQTLITFQGSDLTKPVPGLADFQMSPDQKVLTLKLKSGHVFSDGSPITADDAVFSLQRVQGIAGNPSFLLKDVTVAKVDDNTLTLTSPKPNPALLFILPNTALSVVNAKAVKANGGSTTKEDKADTWLNSEAAGSGPYLLESIDIKSQVKLKRNPKFNGQKPKFDTVVIRNVPGETQKVNIQAGSSHVAMDLSPDQVSGLDSSKAKVNTTASPYVVFLFMNQNPAINKITANPDFVTAVRKGLDYKRLVSFGGNGAVQPGGVVPSMFIGALKEDPTNSRDLEASRAALAKSGYSGQEIPLSFANDLTVQGLQLQTLAAAIQSQLKEVGIIIKLAPAPVASEMDAYRGGKEHMGLWYWGPDYPDPADYLAFAPGGIVGKRAGWEIGQNPTMDDLTVKSAAAIGSERVRTYETWQKEGNKSGPFIPFLQPSQNVAAASSLTELGLNAVWKIDVGALK